MHEKIGFGTYRLELNNPQHVAALQDAIEGGCKTIDTSSSYSDGHCETLVGKVLRSLKNKQIIPLDRMTIISKAGYVQGESLQLAQTRAQQGRPFQDLFPLTPGCSYCISPEYLSTQITQTLEKLQLPQIDLLMIHNPECFFKFSDNHTEYYHRLRKAFEYLELEVQQGRIRGYGVSSNAFVMGKENPSFTSAEILLDFAKHAGFIRKRKSGFQAIQFPFNLFEAQALVEPHAEGLPLFEYAQAHGIEVFTNRPFHSVLGHRLLKLTHYPEHLGLNTLEELQTAFSSLMQLEAAYPASQLIPPEQILWGHLLHRNRSQIRDLESWKQILTHRIEPSLKIRLQKLQDSEHLPWATEYEFRTHELFIALTQFLEAQSSKLIHKISKHIDNYCPELSDSLSLNQKLVKLYLALGYPQTVLVGMRTPAYVKDLAAVPFEINISTQKARSVFENLEPLLNNLHNL